MKTSVRGTPSAWSNEVWLLWEKRVLPLLEAEGSRCSAANYFTPRPWRNEYDRGSATEGFCCVLHLREGGEPRVSLFEWVPGPEEHARYRAVREVAGEAERTWLLPGDPNEKT